MTRNEESNSAKTSTSIENADLSLFASDDQIRLCLNHETLEKIDKLNAELLKEAKQHFVVANLEDEIKLFYDSFRLLLTNESNLYLKLLNLKKENKALNAKYEQALKLSSIDQKAKQDLIEDLEKAWNQASLANSKEKSTMETVKSLKLEISNLSKLVEQGVGLTMGQEYNLRETIKEKEKICSENKQLSEQIEEMKAKMIQSEKIEHESNKIVEEAKCQTAQSNQELLACKLEIQRLSRKNEKSEEEMVQQKRICDNKDAQIVRLNQNIDSLKQEKLKHDQLIKESSFTIEKLRKECEIYSVRQQKLQQEIDQLYLRNDTIQIENGQLMQQLKLRSEAVESQKSELFHLQKNRDSLERKIKHLEFEKEEIRSQKLSIESQIDLLNKNLDDEKKECDSLRLKLDESKSDKEKLNLELRKVHSETEKVFNQTKLLRIELDSYKNENHALKKNYDAFRKNESHQDAHKLKLNEHINQLCSKLSSLNQELKSKDLNLRSNEKEILVLQAKLNESNKMYESARSERNSYSKKLIEIKRENKSLLLELDSAKSHESKLNTFVNEKELELNKLKEELLKNVKLYKASALNLEKKETLVRELNVKILNFESDEKKLLNIIQELENRLKASNKSYLLMQVERNVLGSQMVRRNDEIVLLYEKIKLLVNIIDRGKSSYSLLSAELTKVKLDLNRLNQENYLLKNHRKTMQKLKRDANLIERELYIERAKRRAVERTQPNNIHVHRWRKLNACDPNTYDLVLKVNYLEKRLIAKSEQIACLNLKFVEKDRLFLEMRSIFQRRLMSDEDALLIQKYKQTLKQSSRKLKSLVAENSMFTKINQEQNAQLESARNELNGFKEKYYSTKSDLFHLINT